jgi:hypothetical protein
MASTDRAPTRPTANRGMGIVKNHVRIDTLNALRSQDSHLLVHIRYNSLLRVRTLTALVVGSHTCLVAISWPLKEVHADSHPPDSRPPNSNTHPPTHPTAKPTRPPTQQQHPPNSNTHPPTHPRVTKTERGLYGRQHTRLDSMTQLDEQYFREKASQVLFRKFRLQF